MAENRPGSMLAADFGNVHTRVILVDIVDEHYHVVAAGKGRTTTGYPVDDINVGLHRVLNDFTEITGREFIDGNGKVITPEREDRSGVDYFVATGSAGRPMRAVIVGLIPEVSIASALRAISSSYVSPEVLVHLEDARDEEERLNTILMARPDLVFIAGGTEDGAQTALVAMAEEVRLAVALINRNQRPVVIYAGNSSLVPVLSEKFAELTTFLVAENIRPSIKKEQFESVQLQLVKAFDEFAETRSAGLSQIAAMSSTGVLPTASSYALITEYYARTKHANIITVDIGGSISSLSAAIDGHFDTHIHTGVGLGHSAPALLRTLGVELVNQWIPFYISDHELTNYAMNKRLRPASVPMNLRDLYIEHGMARAAGRWMLHQSRKTWPDIPLRGPMPEIGMIIGAGSALTGTGSGLYNMLLMLDIVQPTGITELKADPMGLIPALGAMSAVHPEAVVQILEGDELEHLGTVINVSGVPRAGSTALRLKITTEDGEVFEEKVAGGSILALPLPPGHELQVQIRVSGGLSIGGKRRLKLKLKGGTGGLVFDARGRSLPLGTAVSERAEQMPRWVHEMTGDPLQEISMRWLREVDMAMLGEEDEIADAEEAVTDKKEDLRLDFDALVGDGDGSEDAPSTKKKRRGFRLFGRRKTDDADKKKDKKQKKEKKRRRGRGKQVGEDDDTLSKRMGSVTSGDAEFDALLESEQANNDKADEDEDELGALRDLLG